MLVPKVISDMVRDRAISSTDVRVWVLATEYLEMVDFRPLKIDTIAKEAAISPSTAHRALEHLVSRGYLERGPRDGRRGARTFRVPLSRIYPRDERRAS